MSDSDAGVQKTGYKVLAHVCEVQLSFASNRLSHLLDILGNSLPDCSSAAKRNRLRFAGCLLGMLADAGDPKAHEVGGTATSEGGGLCQREGGPCQREGGPT